MSPTWKAWLSGAGNAAISGTAAAVGGVMAGVTFQQGAKIVACAAVVSMIKWMAQHPIPGAQQ